MIRIVTTAICLAASALPATAQAVLSVPLPLGPEASVLSATYSCGTGAPFAVQYVNAGVNNLAILPIEGEMRVFVNVISGSGARYVAGEYEWWTKGAEASLRNAMKPDADQQCLSKDYPAQN